MFCQWRNKMRSQPVQANEIYRQCEAEKALRRFLRFSNLIMCLSRKSSRNCQGLKRPRVINLIKISVSSDRCSGSQKDLQYLLLSFPLSSFLPRFIWNEQRSEQRAELCKYTAQINEGSTLSPQYSTGSVRQNPFHLLRCKETTGPMEKQKPESKRLSFNKG